MKPEVQAEYDRALAAVVIRHGNLLKEQVTSVFMQYDRQTQQHVAGCVVTAQRVSEDVWYEFQGTFADNHDVHGITATGVSCTCGLLKDRVIRWQANVSEVAEAVFEEAFDARTTT